MIIKRGVGALILAFLLSKLWNLDTEKELKSTENYNFGL